MLNGTIRKVTIFGVRISEATFADGVDAIARLFDQAGSRAQSLFFVNASTLNIAATDAAYRSLLNRAGRVFGDGTGVRWAAKLRGMRIRANLNGTDVIPALIRKVPGIRVYMLGSTPEDIAKAAEVFPGLFPDAVLCGWRDGYFDRSDPSKLIAEINATRPDLVLVGMGNPLQESFIDANLDRFDARVVAGVGGLFDFWSGKRRRAPQFLRRVGHEWLHILLTERHKARRYLIGNPLFLARMVLWLGADKRADAPATGGPLAAS